MKDTEDRVVKFRPRPAEARGTPPNDVPPDARARADDYRQRLIANLAAAAFAVILTAVGVWLANSLTHMRQTQDCMAMGLRDCSRISGDAPHSYSE
jgi:hypothetical protein